MRWAADHGLTISSVLLPAATLQRFVQALQTPWLPPPELCACNKHACLAWHLLSCGYAPAQPHPPASPPRRRFAALLATVALLACAGSTSAAGLTVAQLDALLKQTATYKALLGRVKTLEGQVAMLRQQVTTLNNNYNGNVKQLVAIKPSLLKVRAGAVGLPVRAARSPHAWAAARRAAAGLVWRSAALARVECHPDAPCCAPGPLHPCRFPPF